MGTTVDSLEIQIAAQAQNANRSINSLITRLDKINASLTRTGGSGMATMAVGVTRLAGAMQQMNNVKTSDFTRLTKNLTNLAGIDVGKIRSVAVAMSGLTKSINNISGANASDGAKQVVELANGIKQLGYGSATKAVENIPKLAVAMRDLMNTLSGAPRVSQNVIDMTNALAKLARTGSASGSAANALSKSLFSYSSSTKKAHKHSFNLASAIGKVYASYWMLFRLFGSLGKSVNLASDLQEVDNVIRTTFGDYTELIDKMAETSISDYGISELTAKQIASRFQAMGTSMGIAQGKMADMSISLTELAADMASFYNVDAKEIGTSLQAIFTGETEPLRKYGLDLTNASIQQWALKQGIDANVDSMSYMTKTLLRYQYVMSNTSAIQGDFARTSGSWANQIRILQQSFSALGSVIGGTVINAFKPFISWLNTVMVKVIAFVETIANALGAIFGWTLEINPGGLADDAGGLDDVGASADNAANGLGNATDKAKELKRALLGFDEIEKLPDENDASGGGSGVGGGTGGAGSADGATAELVKVDSVLKKYESEIKTLEALGEYIGDALQNAMNKIDWNAVYRKASGFGKGLAEFLNGLISPGLFGSTTRTIANSLNTAFYSLNSFGKTFDWNDFGNSIAAGIDVFFANFDFKLAVNTIHTFAIGLQDAFNTAVNEVDWEEVGQKIGGAVQTIFENFKEWLSKVDLVAVGNAIKDFFSGFFAEVDLGDAATVLFSVLGMWITKKAASYFAGKVATSIGTSVITPIVTAIAGGVTSVGFSQVIGAVGAGIAAIFLVKNVVEWLKDVDWKAIGNKIDELISKGIGKIKNAVEVGVGLVKSGWDTVQDWIKGLGKKAKGVIEILAEVKNDSKIWWKNVKDWWKKKVGSVEEFITSVKDQSSEWWDNTKTWWNKKVGAVSSFVTSVKNNSYTWWSNVQKWWNEKVGSVTSFTTSVKNQASTWWSNVNSWWNEKVGSVAKFTTSLKNDASTWWTNTKTWWNSVVGSVSSFTTNVKNNASSWWDRTKSLWGEVVGSVSSFTTNVKNEASTWWDNAKKWWRNNVGSVSSFTTDVKNESSTWWSHVKVWWGNVAGTAASFKTKVKNQASTWWSNVKTWWDNYTKGKTLSIGATVHVTKTGDTAGGNTGSFAEGGIYKGGKWHPVTAAATGGMFNQGQYFIAREAGPELVGTLGGHTAVMNNDQIVSSVSAGVYQAVLAAMGQAGGSREVMVNVALEGDAAGIFRVVKQENDRIVLSTGQPALLT